MELAGAERKREQGKTPLQIEIIVFEHEEQQHMRTLLRSRITNLYVVSASAWTGSVDSAFDFQEPCRASKFVHDAKWEECELELILLFNNSRYDVVVPVEGSAEWQVNNLADVAE